ncbi:ATP-binding cassette domain-containing protein [Alkalihalobacillus sp. 1P02AB]|uniref:ATP-binding cassette domain-containing protein n=1 Tax=Alkalihalobacillus sp. 1P02AB TaxID=3132260 RepID=UPI0039A4F2BF
MSVIQAEKVSKIYRHKKALNELSVTIEEKKITGVIGRNGAGKTTLLKLIAGFYKPSSGTIKVFGLVPFNNINTSLNTVFVDDLMYFPTSLTLEDILKEGKRFYPNWDEKLAKDLFNYFSFNPRQIHQNLSKGMKSTFNMIFGLSARCELTIFDEPTTGMDESVRKDFYRALIKDYINHPRSILLSSHHLNEIEDLLEDVLLIKEGKVEKHLSIAELKDLAVAVQGDTELVTEWATGKEVLFQKSVGTHSSYLVVPNDSETKLEQARGLGLQISSVSASDICVYLTESRKGGIDDVFSDN